MEDKKLDEQEFEELEKTIEEQLEQDDKPKKKKKNKKDSLIEELELEMNSLKEEYLKSKAELENYKKRMNEERIRDRKYAATGLIDSLLLPLDQLKKVVEMEVEDLALRNYLIGFKMINDQIYQVLEDDGLKEIKSLGEKFDPNFHYAVEKENDKEKEDGIILEVINTGYMYKERILRPAMVKVNEWSEEKNEQDNE